MPGLMRLSAFLGIGVPAGREVVGHTIELLIRAGSDDRLVSSLRETVLRIKDALSHARMVARLDRNGGKLRRKTGVPGAVMRTPVARTAHTKES